MQEGAGVAPGKQHFGAGSPAPTNPWESTANTRLTVRPAPPAQHPPPPRDVGRGRPARQQLSKAQSSCSPKPRIPAKAPWRKPEGWLLIPRGLDPPLPPRTLARPGLTATSAPAPPPALEHLLLLAQCSGKKLSPAWQRQHHAPWTGWSSAQGPSLTPRQPHHDISPQHGCLPTTSQHNQAGTTFSVSLDGREAYFDEKIL